MEEIKTYKLEDISVGKGCYGIAASAIPYSHNKRTYLRILILMMMEVSICQDLCQLKMRMQISFY